MMHPLLRICLILIRIRFRTREKKYILVILVDFFFKFSMILANYFNLLSPKQNVFGSAALDATIIINQSQNYQIEQISFND